MSLVALYVLIDVHVIPPDEPPGFLNGTAGADLTAVGIATCWDACLLLC